MKSEELIATKILQNLVSDILGVPSPHDLMKFRKYAEKLLGGKWRDASSQKWYSFLKALFFGEMPTREQIDRIRCALDNSRSIRVRNVKFSTAEEQRKIGSWGNTTKVKTRADTSLSKSEAYRNPAQKPEP